MRISDWSSDVCSSDLLTTDTTLLQTVVGSSVSIAIRNFLLLIGGTVLLVITSAKLTALVFLVVPTVLLPILTYGSRVRRLSRASQDRVATFGVSDRTRVVSGTSMSVRSDPGGISIYKINIYIQHQHLYTLVTSLYHYSHN